jgi:hypothetical protein
VVEKKMTKSVKLRGGGSADVIIPQDNPPAKKIHSAAHLQLVEAETYLVATQATEHGLFMKLSGALVAGCRGVVIGECHKGNSVSSATKATNAGDEVAEQKRDGVKNRSRVTSLFFLLPPLDLPPFCDAGSIGLARLEVSAHRYRIQRSYVRQEAPTRVLPVL